MVNRKRTHLTRLRALCKTTNNIFIMMLWGPVDCGDSTRHSTYLLKDTEAAFCMPLTAAPIDSEIVIIRNDWKEWLVLFIHLSLCLEIKILHREGWISQIFFKWEVKRWRIKEVIISTYQMWDVTLYDIVPHCVIQHMSKLTEP